MTEQVFVLHAIHPEQLLPFSKGEEPRVATPQPSVQPIDEKTAGRTVSLCLVRAMSEFRCSAERFARACKVSATEVERWTDPDSKRSFTHKRELMALRAGDPIVTKVVHAYRGELVRHEPHKQHQREYRGIEEIVLHCAAGAAEVATIAAQNAGRTWSDRDLLEALQAVSRQQARLESLRRRIVQEREDREDAER